MSKRVGVVGGTDVKASSSPLIAALYFGDITDTPSQTADVVAKVPVAPKDGPA